MFYPATKLVIITEHFLSREVCVIIEESGGKGYTQVPVGGKGQHHLHPTQDQATVIEGFDTVKTEVICASRENAEIMARRILSECFNEFPGVMYLEDVQICRPEKF